MVTFLSRYSVNMCEHSAQSRVRTQDSHLAVSFKDELLQSETRTLSQVAKLIISLELSEGRHILLRRLRRTWRLRGQVTGLLGLLLCKKPLLAAELLKARSEHLHKISNNGIKKLESVFLMKLLVHLPLAEF